MAVNKKKKRMPVTMLVFLLTFGIVMALNAISLAGKLILSRPSTKITVVEGELTLISSGEALIARREQIIISPVAGIWNPTVVVGDRLPASAPIGEIIATDTLERANVLMKKANSERLIFEGELATERQQVKGELTSVNDKITSLLTELKTDLAKRRTGQTEQVRLKLQQLLQKKEGLIARAEVLKEQELVGGSWRKIEMQAKEVEAQSVTIVHTPLPGVFVDALDGFENIFDPLNNDIITLDLGQGLGNEEAVATAKAGSNVVQGEILGKIVQEEPALVYAFLEEELSSINKNDFVRVLFAPDQSSEVKAKVIGVQNQEFRSVLLMQLCNVPPELAVVRRTNVQIVTSCVEGCLVPETALRKQEDRVGVYRWSQNKWVFSPVQIKAIDQGQAIVSGIRAGDEISPGPGAGF